MARIHEPTLEALQISRDKFPEPAGWRICIRPVKVETKTKSGVHLPDSMSDQLVRSMRLGQVVAIGDLAYSRDDMRGGREWCDLGDWVMFPFNGPVRFKVKGYDFLICNDDEIISRVENPEEVQKTFLG